MWSEDSSKRYYLYYENPKDTVDSTMCYGTDYTRNRIHDRTSVFFNLCVHISCEQHFFFIFCHLIYILFNIMYYVVLHNVIYCVNNCTCPNLLTSYLIPQDQMQVFFASPLILQVASLCLQAFSFQVSL